MPQFAGATTTRGPRPRPRRARPRAARPAGALECAGVIARPPLPPGPFVVVGLARSGVAAALALRERGAEVVATDARAVDDEVRARLAAAGVAVRDGEDGVGALAGARTVVKSPGVPLQAAAVGA